MLEYSGKDIINKFKDHDKKFKGLFSLYSHFFNILDKPAEKINTLMEELKHELSITNCDKLSITDIEIAYVKLLAKDMQVEENSESTECFVHFFAMLKWFYRNNRIVLENSRLYNKLSRSSRNTIVMESEVYTHEKLRLILKSIDAEPKFMQLMMGKALLLPSYRGLISFLWGVLRSVKNTGQARQFAKVLKSEEACCVIQSLFDKFCEVDVFNNFQVSVDNEKIVSAAGRLVVSLTEDLSEYVHELTLEISPTTDLSREELEVINKELKFRYKELKSLKYQEDANSAKNSEEISETELEKIISEKVYTVDFGLSLQEKKDLLATADFLLLKSDDIKVVPVMDNVRIESIYSVANEILKLDYDAIVIMTKNISHSDVFRVKSLIGNTPIIYTSRTNRRLIIEDVYNQF